jgi:hypothetical protein
VLILHPGPINRGVEISSEVAERSISGYITTSNKRVCYSYGSIIFIRYNELSGKNENINKKL